MNLSDLVRNLGALSRTLNTPRVELWRVLINADGKEICRVLRGSFIDRRRDSKDEPHSDGDYQ